MFVLHIFIVSWFCAYKTEGEQGILVREVARFFYVGHQIMTQFIFGKIITESLRLPQAEFF